MIHTWEIDSHVGLPEGLWWVRFSTIAIPWSSVAALPAHVVFGSRGTVGWVRAQEGEKLHCPLLLCSHQVCVCLRAAVLSEIPLQERILLKSSEPGSGLLSLGLPTSMSLFKDYEWSQTDVCHLCEWHVHLQNRYTFNRVLIGPRFSSVFDLDLFFSPLFLTNPVLTLLLL